MSGLYIPGAEMPTGVNALVIYPDGKVFIQEPDNYQSYMMRDSGIKAETAPDTFVEMRMKIMGDEAAISGMRRELDRLTVQTVEQQKTIEQLTNTNARLRSKIRSMKADASWDEDIRRGQVQGMW